MPIELVASINLWILYVSLVILCFLSFVMHRRTQKATFLLMFIGLIIIILSRLFSDIMFELLFRGIISPQNWRELIGVSYLTSSIGYIISLSGCLLHVFKTKKSGLDKISN